MLRIRQKDAITEEPIGTAAVVVVAITAVVAIKKTSKRNDELVS